MNERQIGFACGISVALGVTLLAVFFASVKSTDFFPLPIALPLILGCIAAGGAVILGTYFGAFDQ